MNSILWYSSGAEVKPRSVLAEKLRVVSFMGIEIVEDLFRVQELVAKKMLRSPHIGRCYSYLSLLLIASILLSILFPLSNKYVYLAVLVTGLIGSTVLAGYLIVLTYYLNRHIDLSKYYYSGIRDIITTVKREAEDIEKTVEDYIVFKRISIEYSPVVLVPAYLALLILPSIEYFLVLVSVFYILCGVLYYEIINRFSLHAIYEEKIEHALSHLLSIERPREFEASSPRLWSIPMHLLTLGAYTVVCIYSFLNALENHITEHRVSYWNFKNSLLKILGRA